MKKSEKIEIRISPEDKEALARRAEAEGRPASEVVRDLLQSGGVTAQAETVPEPHRGRLAAAAGGLVAAGLLLGAGVTALAYTSGEDGVVDVAFDVSLKVTEGRFTTSKILSGFVTVPADALDGTTLFLPVAPSSGYRLTISAPGDADGTQTLDLDLCEASGDTCRPLASPKVTAKVRGNTTRAAAFGADGTTFSIKLVGRAAEG